MAGDRPLRMTHPGLGLGWLEFGTPTLTLALHTHSLLSIHPLSSPKAADVHWHNLTGA